MSETRSGNDAESGSVGSSRGSTWRERRQKWHEDRRQERAEESSGFGEGSYQTQRAESGASGRRRFDERDEELERLRRMVRDLELEAEDRRQRMNQDNRARRPGAGRERQGAGSEQSGYRRQRERSASRDSRLHRGQRRERSRSREYPDRGSDSPEEKRNHNAAMDAMSRALR
ncbi:uncharacterized protein LOC136068599 [Quercus suber]|uniref:uncharacterized protein LOC136068599 n=1 Tax=Quercus suber TaxID=58331 RepID=UPI0032DEC276